MPKAGGNQRFGIRSRIRRQNGLDHAHPKLRKMCHAGPEQLAGRFLRFSGNKPRRPNDGGSPWLRLDEYRTGQLFRTESPPNPVTAERLPLDRGPQRGHLLLKLKLIEPCQKEAEAEILLIGQKFGNVRGGRIEHSLLRKV